MSSAVISPRRQASERASSACPCADQCGLSGVAVCPGWCSRSENPATRARGRPTWLRPGRRHAGTGKDAHQCINVSRRDLAYPFANHEQLSGSALSKPAEAGSGISVLVHREPPMG